LERKRSRLSRRELELKRASSLWRKRDPDLLGMRSVAFARLQETMLSMAIAGATLSVSSDTSTVIVPVSTYRAINLQVPECHRHFRAIAGTASRRRDTKE